MKKGNVVLTLDKERIDWLRSYVDTRITNNFLNRLNLIKNCEKPEYIFALNQLLQKKAVGSWSQKRKGAVKTEVPRIWVERTFTLLAKDLYLIELLQRNTGEQILTEQQTEEMLLVIRQMLQPIKTYYDRGGKHRNSRDELESLVEFNKDDAQENENHPNNRDTSTYYRHVRKLNKLKQIQDQPVVAQNFFTILDASKQNY